ncbi:serine hydrolase activity [Nesidiocoris tenuis]|uniref:Serine hydrolase activity n=1 Tax=Nesidiocoris tenuis TaxID=355587 RepID=A0ABN7AKF0_9HEMI|nr:serine hydrolase activity [Nesidiocoris tenuis]
MKILSRLPLNFSILAVVLLVVHPTVCSDSKIIGGRRVRINNVPFIVSLQARPSGHFCGGSLLSLSSVLTGCHCVGVLTAGTNPTTVPLREMMSFTVQAGSQVLPDQSENAQLVKVNRIIFHPNCSFVQYILYDFAILTLAKELQLNERVKPVQLFSLDRNEYDRETKRILNDKNAQCFVAGWGKNKAHARTSSSYLRAIRMRIISDGDCQQKLSRENSKFLSFNFWRNAQLCTLPFEERMNASDCTGDSGGPFFCGKYIFGVISYGYDCGFWDTPNVYAKVADFVDWYKMLLAEKVFEPRSTRKDYSSVDAISGTRVAYVLPAIATILYTQMWVYA